jgi:hypothetical protein
LEKRLFAAEPPNAAMPYIVETLCKSARVICPVFETSKRLNVTAARSSLDTTFCLMFWVRTSNSD